MVVQCNISIGARKQIIGFAKFRTRQEALDARDALQGRRVDLEKGSVLKALDVPLEPRVATDPLNEGNLSCECTLHSIDCAYNTTILFSLSL